MKTEKYKILAKYIKDLSGETPNTETYLFVKDRIEKYQLGIDIASKALKNKMIEINTTFKFEDKEIGKILIDGKYPFGLIKFEEINLDTKNLITENGSLKINKPNWINF